MTRGSRQIPYSKQSLSFSDRFFVFKSLSSAFITQGPENIKFERELAEKVESKYCLVFSSGTAALHAAASISKELGFEKALVPNLTFIATLNAFRYVGSQPTVGDISESDWNLDWSNLDSRFDVVSPVHFAGNPISYKSFPQARWKGMVIEDASHALGASTPDGPVGNCANSDMTIFSFHPVKSITTGEGGAITTNNRDIYEALQLFRSHGINRADSSRPWDYQIETLGYNYRLTEFQAAMGRKQLLRLDGFIAQRNEIAQFYRDAFAGWGLEISPAPSAGARHAYHLFQVLVPNREVVLQYLHAKGIKVQVHYRALADLKINANVLKSNPDLPVSRKVCESTVSLPIWPGLRSKELRRVVSSLEQAIAL